DAHVPEARVVPPVGSPSKPALDVEQRARSVLGSMDQLQSGYRRAGIQQIAELRSEQSLVPRIVEVGHPVPFTELGQISQLPDPRESDNRNAAVVADVSLAGEHTIRGRRPRGEGASGFEHFVGSPGA